jgi:hypothetical protein
MRCRRHAPEDQATRGRYQGGGRTAIATVLTALSAAGSATSKELQHALPVAADIGSCRGYWILRSGAAATPGFAWPRAVTDAADQRDDQLERIHGQAAFTAGCLYAIPWLG